MFDLKSPHTQKVAPPQSQIYLSKESFTAEEKMIINKGTASSITHTWMHKEEVAPGFHSLYPGQFGLRNQVGIPVGANFSRAVLESYSGLHPIIFGGVVGFQYYGLTASAGLPTRKLRPIQTDEIVIVPLRELPRDYAKKEIIDYIRNVGGRKVYISELAEKLRLDIELIMDIMDELGAE